jgi:hypothetical protein
LLEEAAARSKPKDGQRVEMEVGWWSSRKARTAELVKSGKPTTGS